jgi:CheY-like chemotaxis protein
MRTPIPLLANSCKNSVAVARRAFLAGEKKTILIVDDDEPTQNLLQAVVRRCGLESVTAANGLVAMEIIEERTDLACVILDLMMPVYDGSTVIKHLADTGKNVPVIVCTAAVSLTMNKSFDPAVVRAVIRKPFDVEQLTATLLALVE